MSKKTAAEMVAMVRAGEIEHTLFGLSVYGHKLTDEEAAQELEAWKAEGQATTPTAEELARQLQVKSESMVPDEIKFTSRTEAEAWYQKIREAEIQAWASIIEPALTQAAEKARLKAEKKQALAVEALRDFSEKKISDVSLIQIFSLLFEKPEPIPEDEIAAILGHGGKA